MNPTDANLKAFLRARNRFRSMCRSAKAKFEHDLVSTVNTMPKKFYAYIQQKPELRSQITELENLDGNLTTDSSEQCEIFKSFYSTVFKPDNNYLMPLLPNLSPPMHDLYLSAQEVERELLRLNINKGVGPDGLYLKIIK